MKLKVKKVGQGPVLAKGSPRISSDGVTVDTGPNSSVTVGGEISPPEARVTYRCNF